MTFARQAFKKLMEEHALKTDVDVDLSSGGKSRYYIDCRAVSMTYQGRGLISEIGEEIMSEELQELCPDGIGGVAVGGIPIAMAMADGEDVFIIRPSAKQHGLGKEIEGADHLIGKQVVIVEDTVTTGKSLKKSLNAAAEFGLKPILAISLVTRTEGAVPSSFPVVLNGYTSFAVPYRTVLVAREPGILSIM